MTLAEEARERERGLLRGNVGSIPDWPCGYERPTIEPGQKNTSANPMRNVIAPVTFVHFDGNTYTGEEAIAIGLAILSAGLVAAETDDKP